MLINQTSRSVNKHLFHCQLGANNDSRALFPKSWEVVKFEEFFDVTFVVLFSE